MHNIVHLGDCMAGMAEKPDKCCDLIFIDPPYFQIKGEFDFRMTFEQWKKLHNDLAKVCYRILKDNGTIILWGHARNIAYQQIIFDKYFNLLNVCVWEKWSCQTKKIKKDDMRRFVPITERFLVYDKGEDKSGLTMIYSNPNLFEPIKRYMRAEKEKIKKDYGFKTEKEFNDFINNATDTSSVVSKHYFADSQYMFPTKEIYKKLQNIKTGMYFKLEYEDLRRKYEDLRRPFNLSEKIKYDVIKHDQESHLTGEFNHPTQKPPGLVYKLVKTCTKLGSLVFDPFAGMAWVRDACYNIGIDYEGWELDPDYYAAQEERFQNYIKQVQLFDDKEKQEIVYKQMEI